MLTKNEWKALFFATMTVYAVFGLWYSFSLAKDYKALSDSYIVEVTENTALQKKVNELKTEIVELKAQLPK